MAYQDLNIGSSANDGNGDTLRAGGTKIKANFGEIYARFGSGSSDGATLEAATSANLLVGNGTKFASVTSSGDFNISSAGAINVRTTGAVSKITIPSGSAPGTTANTLYNIGGSLYFNGSVVGTGNVTGMTAFSVTGDSGSAQSVTQGNTVTIAGGTGIASVASATDTITLNIDATVATLTGTQTLTNKTLTSPTITTPSVSGLTLSDASIVLEGATANDFETTLTVTDPTADRTITFPNATGTVALTTDITVTAGSTTTFTNKTIDADGTGNSITNIDNANIKASAGIAVNKLAAATASRALVSDGSGFISASAATATEVGYLSGVTSAIQTQLNAAGSVVSYAITVADDGGGSQNVYVIEGTAIKTNTHIRKVLHLQKGITYKFDQSHSTNGGHPLRFSITPDGARNSGSEYTDGVTTAGTPGSSGAYTQIAVKEDAPDILYIYCTNHDNMGGGHDGQDAPIYTSDVSGWRIQTADRTASAGDRLFINSSGNARTITLPAAAAVGDEIEIINLVGTDTHVVNRNGLNINGGTTNGTIDVAQEGLRLVYSNATIGWVATLIESGINTA